MDSNQIIVLSGPESAGKTTLARMLAKHFDAPLLSEYARTYLQQQSSQHLREPVLPAAIAHIAQAQYAQECRAKLALQNQKSSPTSQLLIADTDLQVIRIWWRYRYGPLPIWLRDLSLQALTHNGASPSQDEELHKTGADKFGHWRRLYLLCEPDIAWEPDPLRSNPDDRDTLWDMYEQDSQSYGLNFAPVSGQADDRFNSALHGLSKLQSKLP